MLRRSCQLWLQGLKPSEESVDQKLVMFILFFFKKLLDEQRRCKKVRTAGRLNGW